MMARIKPTEPLRLAKREARKKLNCSDSSGNSPARQGMMILLQQKKKGESQ
jgi:hypothetical protein